MHTLVCNFIDLACTCEAQGTLACNKDTGTCTCKDGYRGDNCQECISDSATFPYCQAVPVNAALFECVDGRHNYPYCGGIKHLFF